MTVMAFDYRGRAYTEMDAQTFNEVAARGSYADGLAAAGVYGGRKIGEWLDGRVIQVVTVVRIYANGATDTRIRAYDGRLGDATAAAQPSNAQVVATEEWVNDGLVIARCCRVGEATDIRTRARRAA